METSQLMYFGAAFIFLMFLFSGVIIFVLHRSFVAGTDGAIKRLNEEIAIANKKQLELSQKLRAADEELQKRRAEANELSERMVKEAETETKEHREKIISKARQESEEIITKAQNATEKLRQELEKEFDRKVVLYSTEILADILSENSKGAFDHVLIDEYMTQLKEMDMSKISPDLKEIEVITVNQLGQKDKADLSGILKDKLGRSVDLVEKQKDDIGGGVLLKFGSVALDGTLKTLIKEKSHLMVKDIEDRL